MENIKEPVRLDNRDGYPMFFTVQYSNVTSKKAKVKREDYEQLIDANQITGNAHFTIAVFLKEKLKVGDPVLYNREEHFVIDVLETRPTKGSRFDKNAVFQHIKTEFTALSPII